MLAASAVAQQPDYFPLHPGNQWVYRAGGTRAGDPLVLQITRTAVFSGAPYVLLEGWPRGPFWLRQDAGGRLWQYDPDTQTEKLWYSFFAGDGETYRNELPWCCGQARVASRSAVYRGPSGEFGGLLEIGDPTVFQIGIVRELFLPYIGLVHRMENTGGPTVASYDLIYARVGGVTVVEERQVSFRLTLDRTVYFANLMPPVDPRRALPQLTARLTIRSTHDRPLELEFPSSQIFDLVIRDARGTRVYGWSDDKRFLQVLQKIGYGPGETNYVVVAPLGLEGRPLPEGNYTAEAWLTTTGGKRYAATVAFEVRHVF